MSAPASAVPPLLVPSFDEADVVVDSVMASLVVTSPLEVVLPVSPDAESCSDDTPLEPPVEDAPLESLVEVEVSEVLASPSGGNVKSSRAHTRFASPQAVGVPMQTALELKAEQLAEFEQGSVHTPHRQLRSPLQGKSSEHCDNQLVRVSVEVVVVVPHPDTSARLIVVGARSHRRVVSQIGAWSLRQVMVFLVPLVCDVCSSVASWLESDKRSPTRLDEKYFTVAGWQWQWRW